VIEPQAHFNKTDCFHGMLSRNSQMHRLFEKIHKAAQTSASIYISGETGVGKELVARAIHAESPRAKQPFVAVNVATLSSELVECQLFGYKKGAFTGALHNRTGLLQAAKQGTFFLDEIACLTPSTQAKLLRVLQECQYYPVGDTIPKEFTASVISASNLSLRDAIEQNQFREDLRYRLEVIPLRVPPLRDRKEDILLLFKHFLKQASGSNNWVISKTLESKLIHYRWPGNVRELENCARFAAAMAANKQLQLSDLPESMQPTPVCKADNKAPLLDAEIIAKALSSYGGNRTEAAQSLGISRMTLWRKMKIHDLNYS